MLFDSILSTAELLSQFEPVLSKPGTILSTLSFGHLGRNGFHSFGFAVSPFILLQVKFYPWGFFFNLEFLAQILISRSFSELRYFISHNNVSKGLPWRSSGSDSEYPIQVAQVRSLFKDLRSHIAT